MVNEMVYAVVEIEGSSMTAKPTAAGERYIQERSTGGDLVRLLDDEGTVVELGNVAWRQVGPNRSNFEDAQEDLEAGPTKRTIEAGDENMGTAEAASWRAGDRVAYAEGIGTDAAWARVRELLGRRGLELVDDSTGYVVATTGPVEVR